MALLLSLLIGLANGARTFLAIAVVAWAVKLGLIGAGAVGFLENDWAVWLLSALALAELAYDKSPKARSRKRPPAMIARILFGAMAGAVIAGGEASWLAGAITGAIGAAGGTFGTYSLRAAMAQKFGRDLPAALIEDGLVIIMIVVAISLSAS